MQPNGELNRIATQPLVPSNFNTTLQNQSGVLSSKNKASTSLSTNLDKGNKNSYYLKQQLQQNRAKQF
jgi:hypothetical protein